MHRQRQCTGAGGRIDQITNAARHLGQREDAAADREFAPPTGDSQQAPRSICGHHRPPGHNEFAFGSVIITEQHSVVMFPSTRQPYVTAKHRDAVRRPVANKQTTGIDACLRFHNQGALSHHAVRRPEGNRIPYAAAVELQIGARSKTDAADTQFQPDAAARRRLQAPVERQLVRCDFGQQARSLRGSPIAIQCQRRIRPHPHDAAGHRHIVCDAGGLLFRRDCRTGLEQHRPHAER